MTQASFLAFYPQFQSFTPGVVLTEYLAQANARFSDFEEDIDEARRLYVAHRLTMYAASVPTESGTVTKEALAEAGKTSRQEVSSKKVGEVAVSYSHSSVASSVSSGLSDLAETTYGLLLLSLLRIHGFGKYIQ